jgi:hypothetical protein
MHVVIADVIPDGRMRVLKMCEVPDENDIIELWKRFNCKAGVIDIGPERRVAKKLTTYLRGMFACQYTAGAREDRVSTDTRTVTVDRTASLDAVKELVYTSNVLFPRNADRMIPLGPSGLSEFYEHMTASTRVYNEKRDAYEWVEGNAADHYFHAMNYLTIARRMIARAK